MEYQNMRKISFAEALRIVKKALMVSICVKGWDSILVNVLGWFAAFLPVISARCLEDLTNELYQMVNGRPLGEGENTVISLFALMLGLYIVQALFDCLTQNTLRMDTTRTEVSLHRE